MLTKLAAPQQAFIPINAHLFAPNYIILCNAGKSPRADTSHTLVAVHEVFGCTRDLCGLHALVLSEAGMHNLDKVLQVVHHGGRVRVLRVHLSPRSRVWRRRAPIIHHQQYPSNITVSWRPSLTI